MKPPPPPKPLVLMTGPTASGKSALALRLAERTGGVVINADALQVYADLAVLTARPSPADLSRAPHRLYGYRDGATACSAAEWAADARREIEAIWTQGQLPIVVGGTGLYLQTLWEGIAPIPEIPAEIRSEVRDALARHGPEPLHAQLAALDPARASQLQPGDRQRIARALEIVRATGRTMLSFQQARRGGLRDAISHQHVAFIALEPPRALLYTRCDQRLAQMFANGALDEAAALRARGLDQRLPVMKAVGVPELIAHLEGALPLERALADAQQATRRYAKRQMTWRRNQFPHWRILVPPESDNMMLGIEHLIDNCA